MAEAEVDISVRDASGRGGADEAAARKLPGTCTRARVQPWRRSAEVLGRVEVDLRRQHLHKQVVEIAARVVRAEPDEPVIQTVRVTVDDACLVGLREDRHVVDHQRRRQAVDRQQHVVVGVRLRLERRLLVHDPARRVAMAHDELVRGDVDACELERRRVLVVEDDVRVALPTGGRLRDTDRRLHRGRILA